MRGKAKPKNKNMEEFRITPAYAGKSNNAVFVLHHHKDHPRLCGEKVKCEIVFTEFTGSPPPMRGKVVLPIMGAMLVRITPAYAGKSETGRFHSLQA